jgi:hypothetical protein
LASILHFKTNEQWISIPIKVNLRNPFNKIRFLKRSLILIIIVLLFVIGACDDIPRDNILDPKNPDSLRPQKVLIEAFVNTANNFQFNQYMIEALDSLSQLYDDRIIVAEYHRNTEDFQDIYHRSENESHYQNYLTALNSSLKGVPDVFINGIEKRIQGASSVETALFRLLESVSEAIKKNSRFTMDLNFQINDNKLIPEVTLARLQNSDAENILLSTILISRIDDNYHKRVVQGIVKSSLIPKLSGGEVKTITLPEFNLDKSLLNTLIAYVTDINETIVYQCESIMVELNE